MNDFMTKLKAFLQQPYNPQGSTIQWALFVLLILVLCLLWMNVLRTVIEPVKKIAAEAASAA